MHSEISHFHYVVFWWIFALVLFWKASSQRVQLRYYSTVRKILNFCLFWTFFHSKSNFWKSSLVPLCFSFKSITVHTKRKANFSCSVITYKVNAKMRIDVSSCRVTRNVLNVLNKCDAALRFSWHRWRWIRNGEPWFIQTAFRKQAF